MTNLKRAGLGVVAGRALAACALWSMASVVGCASGGGDAPDGGHVSIDTGVRMDVGARDGGPDTGVIPDTGPVDSGMRDSGLCGSAPCTGLTHCVMNTCVAYPTCAGDGSCPTPGDVCTARRCVPGTADPDGDGSPASADCDETDPTRSPLAHEVCNNRDDNCNSMVDDGDPAALCAMDPAHGICQAGGICGCPAGSLDLDLTVPGCECTVAPALMTGADCASAIDLGSVFDSAGAGPVMATATGNALPTGREVWYRFHAVDTADTTCDHYNVHVHFTSNPGTVYEFLVLQGSCGATPNCPDCTAATCTNFTDYRFATDSQTTVGGVNVGECPCAATPTDGMTNCTDDSADYFVRVRRHAGTTDACDAYTLEVTNGMP